MSFYFTLLILLFSIIIGTLFYFPYFKIDFFNIINFSFNNQSLKNKNKKTEEELIPPEIYEEFLNDLKDEYISLKNEMINFNHHIDYIEQENEMESLINRLIFKKGNLQNNIENYEKSEERFFISSSEIQKIKDIIVELNNYTLEKI